MEENRLLSLLEPPKGVPDMVLDTDAYNEIDDQFAIAYLLKSAARIRCHALYAAPFSNEKAATPREGMEKSYDEIKHLLTFFPDYQGPVLRGACGYLADERTPQPSPAAEHLVRLARAMPAGTPLYVVAIGAITNVASALLLAPDIVERIVVVWLGGNALHMADNFEFNMRQDVAAARVVFGSGVPLVQLPCRGVVDMFRVSRADLEVWLMDKSPLCSDLASRTIAEAERYAAGTPWTRVIWDVTAVAWLMNDPRLMDSRVLHRPIPQYDHHYSLDDRTPWMRYVCEIRRDALMDELFRTLTRSEERTDA